MDAPWGYDKYTHTEVVPKPPPKHLVWRIGPVRAKRGEVISVSETRPFQKGEIIMQLTADQQVDLSITGEDAYNNPVDISGDVVWVSSDESIIQVTQDDQDPSKAVATAVGPIGTASVTVNNDINDDGTMDFQGSLAIDVVAGDIAEIVVQAGPPVDKA